MADEFKLAAIGLDTSHTVEFTRRIQGDLSDNSGIEGLRVVQAMRFPSAFQSEEGQDERQARLESFGVTVGTSMEEAVTAVDGILIEANDGAMHLALVEQVADLGLPVFLDKPLAGSLDEGRKIVELAEAKSLRIWTSSSCRFSASVAEARDRIPDPLLCGVLGPLGKAAAGSDLVWYGVHSVEMLQTLMGAGAQRVFAVEDPQGIVAMVYFDGSRRGVIEANRNARQFAGRVQTGNDLHFFDTGNDRDTYTELLKRVRSFFLGEEPAVPLRNSLEVQAILDAAERSLASGAMENVV